MANKIQLKRGLKSRLTTLSAGEPAYTTDTREFFIGTGSGNVNMGGSQWYTGTAMSGTSEGSAHYYSACPEVKVGDMYLNTDNGYIYQCVTAGSGTTARWTYKGCIKGTPGANAVLTTVPDIETLEGNYIRQDYTNKFIAKNQFPDDGDIYFIKRNPEIEMYVETVFDKDGQRWDSVDSVGDTHVKLYSKNSYILLFVKDYFDEYTLLSGGRCKILACGEADSVKELIIKSICS